MKLLDLTIDSFGKFHNRSIYFEDGLNIVYGKNETGKSTLHTFIRGMLFGLERGRGRAAKNDLYSKYEPWESGGHYQGRIRLEKNGHIYRIERRFQKDDRKFIVVDETIGKELKADRATMEELLCGLSETSYTNTISIGQLKSATESGMISELKNYIANLNTSGNMALNITKASSYLKNQRRQLDQQMTPEAARTYTALLGEIRNIEKEISSPVYENQLASYQNMRSQVKTLLEEKQEEKEALLEKIARGRQVLSSSQFTDETSIHAYQKETDQIYQDYQNKKKACSRKSKTLLTIVCFCLSLLMAGFGIYSYVTKSVSSNPFLLWGILYGGALLLTFLGIYLVLQKKRLVRELALNTKLLQEVFSRHLGDSSVDDNALNAFHARMAEFLRLNTVLEKSETTLQEHTEEIASLQQKQANCDEVIEEQQKNQWELEQKLERLAECKDQADALIPVLAENDRLRDEINAVDLALETMTNLSTSIRDSFGLYLNKAASQLIHGITGGIYDSMSVDENLNVYMNTKTKLVPIDQVSSGTMDQIYLALRLAAARLIQNGDDEMPLIFDDSFVLYDDERLTTALQWLSQAYQNQTIIFTCHRREIEILESYQIPFHLIEM